MGFLQQVSSNLGRQAPRDFAHRCQQRQAAVLQLHGFVGDGSGACLQQGLANAGIGGQVQVGEQHHVLPQIDKFLRLRFLHLHHQMGAPGLVAAHHLGTGGGEGVVTDSRSSPGSGFDAHLQALAHQFPHRIGSQRHALLIELDLLRHTDAGHRGRENGGCHGGFKEIPSIWLRCAQPATSQGWDGFRPLQWATASRCRRPGGSP